MRKLLISAMVLSAALAAAPAAAQSYNSRGGHQFDRQIDQLVTRIHRAEDRDFISKREESRLLNEARNLRFLERRYQRGGFSRWEASDLQNRIQRLRAHVRMERADLNNFGRRR